jgi:hypothetical protein
MKKFLHKMPKNKIKINLNKNPIRMDFFLSLLTVDLERSKGHLGSYTGWTLFTGKNGLKVGGGNVQGIEYIDNLSYGKNLDNDFNNFVNPFYLFEIFNEKGKKFFLEYYANDIQGVLDKAKADVEIAKQAYNEEKEKETEMLTFWTTQKLI